MKRCRLWYVLHTGLFMTRCQDIVLDCISRVAAGHVQQRWSVTSTSMLVRGCTHGAAPLKHSTALLYLMRKWQASTLREIGRFDKFISAFSCESIHLCSQSSGAWRARGGKSLLRDHLETALTRGMRPRIRPNDTSYCSCSVSIRLQQVSLIPTTPVPDSSDAI